MKNMRYIYIVIIMIMMAVTITRAEDSFGPGPGTETNPLLNIEFKTIVGEAFRFNNSTFGYPPTFPFYLGYKAEYADGTVVSDSTFVCNNPADNPFVDIQFFGFNNYKYSVNPGLERWIDDETKTVNASWTGVERVYSSAPIYDDNPQEVELFLNAVRNGRQRRGFVVDGNHPDTDDVSYNMLKFYEKSGLVVGSADGRGFKALLYVYDQNDQERAWIGVANAVPTNPVYIENYNTVSQNESVELLDWNIEFTPLGNKYGYEETVKIDIKMDLGYYGHIVRVTASVLNHFVLKHTQTGEPLTQKYGG